MPAWVLLLTFHEIVKQYGLHNLAPLIIVTGRNFPLRSAIHHVLSAIIHTLSWYPLHIMATARRDAPTKYLPTWWETRRRTGGCQGLWNLQNTGKENFYTHLLETLLTKRTMILSRCFCCFMPVIYFFSFEYVNSLNFNQTFICKPW